MTSSVSCGKSVMIAATAISLNTPLVMQNKHFNRLKEEVELYML